MSAILQLALSPRDGLACRDGRGWAPIGAGRAYALEWPWPSTILGALRTAVGRTLEAKTGRPFAKADWQAHAQAVRLRRLLVLRAPRGEIGWQRLWPRPLDATAFEDDAALVRLDPQPAELPTLGRDEDPAREALWRPRLLDPRKPTPLPAWWSEAAFARWLAGERVAPAEVGGDAPQRRLQTHVGIEADTLTAEEGRLFSEDVLETLDRKGEWAIGAELELPEKERLSLATLGADRRLARIETLDERLFAPPEVVLKAFGQGSKGLRLILVTPASFEAGWRPDGFAAQGETYLGRLPGIEGECLLRAAITGRPLAVSGWDLAAGGPKRTDRSVPPGSVYFFERADGRPFGRAEAEALWLAAIGRRTEEGFGRVVPGIWHPTDTITPC